MFCVVFHNLIGGIDGATGLASLNGTMFAKDFGETSLTASKKDSPYDKYSLQGKLAARVSGRRVP